MAKEIERKFLIDKNRWRPQGKKIEIEQAYLVVETEKVVRVRITGDEAFLTIKGNLRGISRDEFEYAIPKEDARSMMSMKVGSIVEKTRYVFDFAGKTWEVDVFKGENEGLILAEIELEHENESFQKPEWVLEEVSTKPQYFNFSLAHAPYKSWQ